MHLLLKNIGLQINRNKFEDFLTVSLLLLFVGSFFLGPSRRLYCILFYIFSFHSLLLFYKQKYVFQFITLNIAAFIYAIILTINHVISFQFIDGIKTLIYSFILCISIPHLLIFIKVFEYRI